MSGHIPVLLGESIEALSIKPDGIYVDCTCGRAGHSSEILKRLSEGYLICFDQDEEAIESCKERLDAISSNYKIVRRNFAELDGVLDELGIDQVDGILADLGVSSPQFDDPSRGFSYNEDARLDMRMDQRSALDAEGVVNTYSLQDLTRIFREFGEDGDAYAVAKAICEYRKKHPIHTTFQLVDIIKGAKPAYVLAKKGHPAKQIFQAIRIEVNHEEEALMSLLEAAPRRLRSDGRLAIITFMSIDDRLVKQAFHRLSVNEGNRDNLLLRPSDIKEPDYRLYSHKPILPTEAELAVNRRASSAKLRVLIRK